MILRTLYIHPGPCFTVLRLDTSIFHWLILFISFFLYNKIFLSLSLSHSSFHYFFYFISSLPFFFSYWLLFTSTIFITTTRSYNYISLSLPFSFRLSFHSESWLKEMLREITMFIVIRSRRIQLRDASQIGISLDITSIHFFNGFKVS